MILYAVWMLQQCFPLRRAVQLITIMMGRAGRLYDTGTVRYKLHQTALYNFTKDSLTQMLDAGIDVGMVQVGNEINNGMAGEEDVSAVMSLICEGSRAVREVAENYQKDIQVAVHYTNIEDNEEVDTMAANLADAGVDYDLFGLSYYPFWDGTNENMQNVARNIEEKYGKKVYIAETSYCYTSEDGDGFDNSLKGTDDLRWLCGNRTEPGNDDPGYLRCSKRGRCTWRILPGRNRR